VDRAQKELNIEKQIKKIEDTWAALAILFTPYQESDIMSLQVSSFDVDMIAWPKHV
jgi:dynein heavy chain